MQVYEGPSQAADATRNWLIIHEADIPEHLHDRLMGLTVSGTSPLPMMADFIAAVYANRDAFPNEAKEIAAGLADLFERSGYHGKLQGQAVAIGNALRRDSGEEAAAGSPWPDPETDPEPRGEFLPPQATPDEEPLQSTRAALAPPPAGAMDPDRANPPPAERQTKVTRKRSSRASNAS